MLEEAGISFVESTISILSLLSADVCLRARRFSTKCYSRKLSCFNMFQSQAFFGMRQ